MKTKLGGPALLAAAVSGLILGACKGSPSGPSGAVSAETPASAGSGTHKGEKACCKGLNDCKGKGGCAVAGKHDCAGKNDCKGQGGCNMHCPT